MDDGVVSAIPELTAHNVDAALIHEAAIGKIAGEQITKLMTLGLTEKQAEEKIIEGFLKYAFRRRRAFASVPGGLWFAPGGRAQLKAFRKARTGRSRRAAPFFIAPP